MNIVVFSGAGLSAESGIPTFRDSGGLWEQHRIEDVASPEGWTRNKQLVLDFYGMRFRKQQECIPNPAHYAIAELSKHFHVTNITQNIDTLLERAGNEQVWHLHGRIDMQKCEYHRSLAFDDDDTYSCDFRERIENPITLEIVVRDAVGSCVLILYGSANRWICGRNYWMNWLCLPIYLSVSVLRRRYIPRRVCFRYSEEQRENILLTPIPTTSC